MIRSIFLIPHPGQIKKTVDIPELLKEEGFIPLMNYSNGLVRYQHPGLMVEFLAPELGRGFHKPRNIRSWNIQAQEIRYQNITVCVPEPAAFALHKLIISARRTKKEKREKDLETAVGILEFLFKDSKEEARARAVLAQIPAKWRKVILTVSEKYFPTLNELYKSS